VPLKQKSEIERFPARRKKAVIHIDECIDDPQQWRVIARRAHDRKHARPRAGFCGGAAGRPSAVLGVRFDHTLDEPGPIGFRQTGERFTNVDAVEEFEARVSRPIYKFLLAHEPVVPIAESPYTNMGPDTREYPIEGIVGERKASAWTGQEDMAARPHDPRKLTKTRARIDDMLDHLEATRDVETSIVERQLLGIGDAIIYPFHVRVQKTRVRNVALV